MKLSILTAIVGTAADLPGLRDMKDMLRMLHDAGYDTLDIGLADQASPDFILRQEDWQQRIGALGEEAAKLGVVFAQSHLPYIRMASPELDPNWSRSGYPEFFAEMLRRAYTASGMLGIRYATQHPLTYLDAPSSPEVMLERNRAYYDPFVEWGIRQGVGTAFENMRPESPQWSFPVRYGQFYPDLIQLADSYRDPMVGICWDTGHANQAMHDQGRALRAIGGRLKNLHLNDNHYGGRDEHLLPYMGEVDWPAVLEALVDIDYQGVLNYEVGKVAKTAPSALQPALLESCHANGVLLLEMYDTIRREKRGE